MKGTVLIVDDDASVRKSIQKVLRAEDYEVLLAADGEEALERFDPHEIDIVLLDVNLPRRNGWDTFERMTARKPLLPVIVITAIGNQCPVAVAAGVSALLEKPLDAPLLLRTIEVSLAEPEQQRLRRLLGESAACNVRPAATHAQDPGNPPGRFPRPPFTELPRLHAQLPLAMEHSIR
jgi:DNA-binding NtrC family response regulator